jgi:hypothetical protein
LKQVRDEMFTPALTYFDGFRNVVTAAPHLADG